ncbi:hypothetical protein GQ457_10G015160 [Hibiscus cannabinus]
MSLSDSSSSADITSLPAPSSGSLDNPDSSSLAITCHRLTGNNYLEWSQSVKIYVVGRGRSGYLTGNTEQPNATTDAAGSAKWLQENNQVMSWLLNSMIPSVGRNFLLYTSAAEIWTAVQETYSSKDNDSALYGIEEQIFALKQEGMGVTAYYNSLQSLWQQIDLYENNEWSTPNDVKENTSTSLLAVAVGIKQKDLVDKLVMKFLSNNGFVVMLFHYDGIVDEWKQFEWCDKVIHVSARNQTKWWFAKRFLHPDIVSEYSYIFLWDEDLGVENFRPEVYVSIIEHEGLEISQPALDRSKSEVHHQITARERKSIVHSVYDSCCRRTFKNHAKGKRCDDHSKDPPCTGWIEMMAPVFSRAAWRCVWYMVQNDLIHAWGIDMQVGYCAQGDRTDNIGIVDAEYVVHHNRPSLGDDNVEKHVKGRRLDKQFCKRRTSLIRFMLMLYCCCVDVLWLVASYARLVKA